MRTAARRNLLLAAVVLLVAVGLLLVRQRGPGDPRARADPLPEGASSRTVTVGELQRDHRAHRPGRRPVRAFRTAQWTWNVVVVD